MNGKNIVITGGTKGLGRALAEQFIADGYQVIICGKEKEELEIAAKKIGAVAFVADVTQESDIKALADFAMSSFGSITVWINNAGVWIPHAPVEQLDMERVRKIFDVNVFGAMYGSKFALTQMRKQESGIIINIISTSGLSGRPNSSGYCASKWALRGFTDSLREECRNSPIKIISVYPGGMKTSLFDEQKPDDRESYMTPESVAQKVIENLKQKSPQDELIIKRDG